MNRKEPCVGPIWSTDGGGSDEFINGYDDNCKVCKVLTHHTRQGKCSYCLEVAERRAEFFRDTRDDYVYSGRE
jgi:hypothetical protein